MDYAAIEKLKKDRNISKILIFGTGSYWKNIMGYINNLLVEKLTDAVDFFIDNDLSLIHISEPTRLLSISYAVFCLKKKIRAYSNITLTCTFTTL